MSKIKTITSIKTILKTLRKQGKKIVFTNGCFDIIHAGHVKVFAQAKAKGDLLIIGLNSDSSIKRIKGPKRPIVDQISRAKVLEAMQAVDYIVIFDQDTPYELIKAIKPDCLVKGGDWEKGKIIGSEFAKKVCQIKLAPGKSTTNIIEKILTAYS
jgi:rfaE bifunctional protein nucleotidyltransferase chain/domain